VAAAVDTACRQIGFFVITGHDFDLDLLHRTRDIALEFFRQPIEVKAGESEGSFMGYSPFKGERLAYSLGEETPPDLKEGYSIARPDKGTGDYWTHPEAQQVFPDNVYPSTPVEFEALAVAY
jgi:isopenicillin N synthase-like dioxygenase